MSVARPQATFVVHHQSHSIQRFFIASSKDRLFEQSSAHNLSVSGLIGPSSALCGEETLVNTLAATKRGDGASMGPTKQEFAARLDISFDHAAKLILEIALELPSTDG
jgi:hypothetical protein